MLHELPKPGGEHLEVARQRVLKPIERHGPPPVDSIAVADVEEAVAVLRDQLRAYGLGLIRFDAKPADAELIGIGEGLGMPMPESAPEVRSHVTDGVLLHLRQQALSGSVHDAPFERRELTLHTEGSRRPAAHQPGLILLYCDDPGDDTGAQTVLVPSSAVLDQLDRSVIDVLSATREARVDGTPTIIRSDGGCPVFSFRDLGEESYLWDSEHSRAELEYALAQLLLACYSSPSTFGSHWRERDLIVIDNRQWFHGRTWSPPSTPHDRPRHLRRLRIR